MKPTRACQKHPCFIERNATSTSTIHGLTHHDHQSTMTGRRTAFSSSTTLDDKLRVARCGTQWDITAAYNAQRVPLSLQQYHHTGLIRQNKTMQGTFIAALGWRLQAPLLICPFSLEPPCIQTRKGIYPTTTKDPTLTATGHYLISPPLLDPIHLSHRRTILFFSGRCMSVTFFRTALFCFEAEPACMQKA